MLNKYWEYKLINKNAVSDIDSNNIWIIKQITDDDHEHTIQEISRWNLINLNNT